MDKRIKYCAKWWSVSGGPEEFKLLQLDPPESAKGRTLLAKKDGVWECSRDGKATPLVRFDQSWELHERCTKE